MDLGEKIAIVTGVSSGLGAALAQALVEKRATVYGLARNVDKLNKFQKRLGEAFIPVRMDITDAKAIATWVKRTFSEAHLPNILINNAGVGYLNKIDEVTSAEWHEMINTNLNGTFYLTTNIVPFMKQNNESCHIVNIGSILGTTTHSDSIAYSATKYGIQGFSEALFKDLRTYNIKVTCVNPGSIGTRFFEQSGIEPHNNMLQSNDLASLLMHILETPDNMLINEITVRPLNTKIEQKEHRGHASPVCYANSSEVRKEFLDEASTKQFKAKPISVNKRMNKPK